MLSEVLRIDLVQPGVSTNVQTEILDNATTSVTGSALPSGACWGELKDRICNGSVEENESYR
jgi:hypothetical protein